MSQEGYQKAQPIAGFAGEDTNHLPFSVPANVATYGLNNDYYRGTIRKRNGLKRIDDRAMGQGSISIRQDGVTFQGTNSIGALTWTPAASWAISFSVQMQKSACTGTPKVMRLGTAIDTSGVTVYYDKANERFYCEIGTSGGVVTLNQSVNSYQNDVIAHLMIVYYVAENGTKYYRFYQNTTKVETSSATDTYTAPGASMLRFAYDSATTQIQKFWLGELRLWDLASASDTVYNAWLAWRTTDLNYLRELTDAEQADSRLTHYWRFVLAEYSYGNGFNDTVGSGTFVVPTPALGTGISTREIALGRAMVASTYDTDWPECTALTLWPSDFGECWVRFGAEIWLHVNQTSVSPAMYATRCSEFHNFTSGVPIKEAWSVCRYKENLVAVHPHVCCLHLGRLTGTPAQFAALVPYSLTSTPTAADKGSGTGPGAGTYRFKFYYYNSATGVHSLASSEVSVTMASGNAIEFSGMSGVSGLRRPLDGVDKLHIFRTKNGANTFYYADEITLSASPSSTYSGVGINQLDSALIEANSEQALRYDMAKLLPYRARACFQHLGYLMLIAPNEQTEYATAIDFRDPYNNAVMWAEPDSVHLFQTNNYQYILQDVSDFLTGGISVAGGALLAKRYSLVGLYGDTPSNWIPRHISHAHGCISHNSIAASDQYVYLLSDRAIVRVPVSLAAGSAEDVTSDKYRDLFSDIDASKIGRASGVYHKTKQQYWVSFDTLSNGRVTVVFNERTGAIARYDIEIEAFCLFQANDPSTAENKLVGSWRGYIVELDSGTNDGADVEAHTEILTGTVTGGDAQSVTDSVRSWTTSSYYAALASLVPYASLKGLQITIQRASDYVKQTRTIVYNTGTRIWVDRAWDYTPGAGDSYFIAGIAWDWRSKKISPQGDPGEDTHTLRLAVWQNPQSVAKNVNLYCKADDVDIAPSTDFVFPSNQRYQEVAIAVRARECEIRFTNILADQPVEIEAFQLQFEEVKLK